MLHDAFEHDEKGAGGVSASAIRPLNNHGSLSPGHQEYNISDLTATLPTMSMSLRQPRARVKKL
jgi:hypothetical protein